MMIVNYSTPIYSPPPHRFSAIPGLLGAQVYLPHSRLSQKCNSVNSILQFIFLGYSPKNHSPLPWRSVLMIPKSLRQRREGNNVGLSTASASGWNTESDLWLKRSWPSPVFCTRRLECIYMPFSWPLPPRHLAEDYDLLTRKGRQLRD